MARSAQRRRTDVGRSRLAPAAIVVAHPDQPEEAASRARLRLQRGSSAHNDDMSLSASEFYEAGMSLPTAVRKDVALRLLESVDPDEAFDRAAEEWLHSEAAAAHDAH